MTQRWMCVFVLAAATGSALVSACSDDDSNTGPESPGSAGAAGGDVGGSSAGGSTNNAGSSSGGEAGGAVSAGAGGAPDAAGGAGGASAGAAGSGDSGGAAGAGGAGEPGLVYACGSANLWQKTCSAWVAAECPDATVCSDCVTALTADREGFTDPACATCDDKYEAFYQCQVDAFESDNLALGVECLEGVGAVETENCFPLLDEAIMCQGYVSNDNDPKPCPATWPPQ